MSSESENKKDISAEVSDASVDKVEDEANTSEDSQDNVKANADKDDEKDSTNEDSKDEDSAKSSVEKPSDVDDTKDKLENDLKKGEVEDVNNKDEKEGKKENNDSKTDEDTENDDTKEEEVPPKPTKAKAEEPTKKGGKKGVTTSNKIAETSETRKKANKAKIETKTLEDFETKEEKTDTAEGKGTQLGEIPRVDASISRFKNDDLKLLYRLLFKTPGKTALIAKSIKKFNGFGFKKDTEEYTKKIESAKKFEIKQLKSICEMLDLEKKGTKDEIAERIIDFLVEPKDSGKQAGGGRPKRTAAVRANNRGYSSHDDSYSSDERRGSRGRRGKGKRPNLKDETTSESDEEFQLSDTSETKSRTTKRKKSAPKAVSDEEDISEVDDPSTDESDVDRKKRKTKKAPPTAKPKAKPTPSKRGRKPVADTDKKPATPKKNAGRKRALSEESEAAHEENASSSEDEPLIKKAKSPQPPTDEEIKKYVKEILDGANLEEITMKTVCKQVYAHYPDFDLAHKKDFIKSTVKSLIST